MEVLGIRDYISYGVKPKVAADKAPRNRTCRSSRSTMADVDAVSLGDGINGIPV